MLKKRHSADQIVTKLRQIDVQVAQGRIIGQASKEAEIAEQNYYCWPNEYGDLETRICFSVRSLYDSRQPTICRRRM